MHANLNHLSGLLDSLTHKAMDLLSLGPNGQQVIQQEMAVMRVEIRKTVKAARRNLRNALGMESKSRSWSYGEHGYETESGRTGVDVDEATASGHPDGGL